MCHMHVKIELGDPVPGMQCRHVKGYVPFGYESNVAQFLLFPFLSYVPFPSWTCGTTGGETLLK